MKIYFTGWFIVDFVSIIPINLIASAINNSEDSSVDVNLKDLNQIARLTKITRMYRLVKLTKYKNQ